MEDTCIILKNIKEKYRNFLIIFPYDIKYLHNFLIFLQKSYDLHCVWDWRIQHLVDSFSSFCLRVPNILKLAIFGYFCIESFLSTYVFTYILLLYLSIFFVYLCINFVSFNFIFSTSSRKKSTFENNVIKKL